jgi:uncharacterized double-CXXCG motif protein
VERLNELRDRIRPLLPDNAYLPPGTDFGPFKGAGRGQVPDFAFSYPWSALLRSEALDKLQSFGVRGLVAAEAQVRFRGKNPPRLLELQFERFALLSASCLPRWDGIRCPKCDFPINWPGIKTPGQLRLIVERTSIPSDVDLFRCRNYSTIMLVTERFIEAAHEFKFTGATFTKVDLE